MGSLSFSEIVVIVLVILVVFGPKRLPELARKAGELMNKVRRASSSLTESLGDEYQATVEPIQSVKQDYDGLKSDLTKAVTSIGTPLDAGDSPPGEDSGGVVSMPERSPEPSPVDDSDPT
jgi:Tat protein translocase TatB subunit